MKTQEVERTDFPAPDATAFALGAPQVPSPGTPGEGEGGGCCENKTVLTCRTRSPHPSPPPEYREREPEEPLHESQCSRTDDSAATSRRAVFLDRDGVLNGTDVRNGIPHPPATPEDVRLLPRVEQAMRRLHAAGYLLIAVTNQPDVARGTQTRQAVLAINAVLRERLPLDGVYVCFHDTPDACACRKPLPGMLHQAAKDHHIDLSHSVMVGDRWSDIAAGQAAGCATYLIDRPYSQSHRCNPDGKVADLYEAADCILAGSPATGK